MGKKIDFLLGRRFKTSKFKATVNLAVSRLPVLRNQRQGRCSVARSDVVELLNLGHHERALLRVEQVIKEQNMVDVYLMIEGYCHVLIERVNLVEQERICPDELKETVSSMVYAATRCGEFPELQELRAVFTSRFGKEFVARAIDLRNNCGVNPKMIQKLSTRTPSLENRYKVLKEIASENGIVLQIEELSVETPQGILRSNDENNSQTNYSTDVNVHHKQEKLDLHQNEDQPKAEPSKESRTPKRENEYLAGNSEEIERVDVFSDPNKARRKYRDVVHAAQAAFESAAYAAAAARAAVELSRSESHDSDDPSSPNPRPRMLSGIQDFNSESDNEETHIENTMEQQSKRRKDNIEYKRSLSVSSSDSAGDYPPKETAYFDESNDEMENESLNFVKSNVVKDEGSSSMFNYPSHRQLPIRNPMEGAQGLINMEHKPISMRTRRNHGR